MNKAWETVVKFYKNLSYGFIFSLVMIGMVATWIWWGFIGSSQFLQLICIEGAECHKLSSLGALGDIFGGVNALFAGLALGAVAVSTSMARQTFITEQQWTRDEKFTEQVQRSYEWSYAALTENGQFEPPKPDALKWERCARHLIRAKRIQNQVKTPELKAVLEEYEEYWRYRFFEVLDSDVLVDPKYFEALNGGWHKPSSDTITSVMLVNDFVNQKGKVNSLLWMQRQLLDVKKLYSKGKAGSGLSSYLASVKERYKQKLESQPPTVPALPEKEQS